MYPSYPVVLTEGPDCGRFWWSPSSSVVAVRHGTTNDREAPILLLPLLLRFRFGPRLRHAAAPAGQCAYLDGLNLPLPLNAARAVRRQRSKEDGRWLTVRELVLLHVRQSREHKRGQSVKRSTQPAQEGKEIVQLLCPLQVSSIPTVVVVVVFDIRRPCGSRTDAGSKEMHP